jgi:hypothetical protein
MVWNALSTFEASSAEVSMNDNPFSAKGVPGELRNRKE